MFDKEREALPNWVFEGQREFIYWTVSRGCGIFILILLFHTLLYFVGGVLPASPLGARAHLLATSIFSTGILTFALIAVYWGIRETQSDQAEILEKQESLMEASHLPTVEPLEVDPMETVSKLNITLENGGNGPALSLSATVHFSPVEPDSGEYKMPDFPYREIGLGRLLERMGLVQQPFTKSLQRSFWLRFGCPILMTRMRHEVFSQV